MGETPLVCVQGLAKTFGDLEVLRAVDFAVPAGSVSVLFSGGRQQRVGIARALALKPVLMLFDGPTSALDPELIGDVLAVMKDLAGEGRTMIVVTHEIRFARSVADQVLFMDGGVVVEHGSPDAVLGNPQQPRTQGVLAPPARADLTGVRREEAMRWR